MSDKSTRSGMLWEVERILSECKELGTMPEILLMENVPQVHGADNLEDFNKWQLRLEELGYKNYWQDLIATDYGIPQTRNRTFMVSVLGNYNYSFPQPIKLEKRLKDFLEQNVSKKYYLSERRIKNFSRDEVGKFPKGARFKEAMKLTNEKNLAATITTREGNVPTANFIKIKTANKKGYIEGQDGDGVDISGRMQYHRGTVQKGKSQCITCGGGEQFRSDY